MKKLNFLAAALVSAMTLFTSCLGNGGNSAEFSATGIVFLNDKAGFKQMVDVGSAYLYIPQLETAEYGEGDSRHARGRDPRQDDKVHGGIYETAVPYMEQGQCI